MPDCDDEQEFTTARIELTPTRSGAAAPLERLVCVTGPDVGRTFLLEKLPVVIGRGAEAEVRVQAEDVSRQHARISRIGRNLVIEELGSRNGTAINGKLVTGSELLELGDRVQIGGTVTLVYGRHDELEARAQQLQRLDSLGELAGGLAHDFNNMLMVILSGIETIELWASEHGCTDRDLVDPISEIRSASSTARDLTRQLLDFSRREPVRELSAIPLEPLVDEIVSMVRRTMREPVEISVAVEPGLAVMGNRRELQQVLLNLCFNARDAMPSGGKLSIETRSVTLGRASAAALDLADGGDFIELDVTDTGTGMDADTVARAFEPFFTTKPAGRGTGLGLSSVYGVVRSHGGSVAIESELGRGTRMRVVLPAPSAELKPPRTRTRPMPKAAPPRHIAIVVDDSAASRSSTARMMRSIGLETGEFDGGPAALANFREVHAEVSVVVLDRLMPGMSGEQTLKEMRLIDREVKIMMISGGAGEAAAREFGADAFLRKPFSIEAIRETLERLGVLQHLTRS